MIQQQRQQRNTTTTIHNKYSNNKKSSLLLLLINQLLIPLVVFLLSAFVGHFHGRCSTFLPAPPLNTDDHIDYYSYLWFWTKPTHSSGSEWSETTTTPTTPPTTTTILSSPATAKDEQQQQQQQADTTQSLDNNETKDDSDSLSLSGWREMQVFAGDTQRHLQAALMTAVAAANASYDNNENNNNNNNNSTLLWLWEKNHHRQPQQNMLTQLILGLLRHKRGGYFVDLAAGDAGIEATSNTLGLEVQAQWKGLCIEANPVHWYGLAYYRTCQVVAAVVVAGSTRQNDSHQYDENGDTHRDHDPHHHHYHREPPMLVRYSNYQREYFGCDGNAKKKNNPRGASIHRRKKFQFPVTLLEILQRNRAPRVMDYFSFMLNPNSHDDDTANAGDKEQQQQRQEDEVNILQHFPFSEYTFSIITLRPHQLSTGGGLQETLFQAGYQVLSIHNTTNYSSSFVILAHSSAVPFMDLSVLQ